MGKPTYDAHALIRMFISMIGEKYPHLTNEQIVNVCKYQFVQVRKEMQKGTLRTIRLKYFGSFRVFKGRVIGTLNKAKKMQNIGRIKKERLEEIEQMAQEYLEGDDNIPFKSHEVLNP
jgi:hypothetical protein